ncbi:MAG: type II toxin-antitoxin system Phd/YefM family antitoxin [Wenzhouxiangellaceae bacterium]|nr:type II toxin-antitoxin system Phd/YefM family antitoxin [Wenzhouxiangellaceae bacterium]
MKQITATELARNLSAVLDQVRESGEDYVVERARQPVARLSPTPGRMTAEQALADLYQTLDPVDAETWQADARRGDSALSDELRDPWAY